MRRAINGKWLNIRVAAALPLIVFDGNSLTYRPADTDVTPYPTQCVRLLGEANYEWYNFGVGGQITTQMTADAPTEIDVLFDRRRSKNIVVAWEVSNDLFFGASAATAYANYVAYCNARRAAGFTVVAVTVLPRSGVGTPGSFEADRGTVNTSIRSNWHSFAHALADVAADSRIGDAGDENDATYYKADLVHLTNVGAGVVAQIVADAIETV